MLFHGVTRLETLAKYAFFATEAVSFAAYAPGGLRRLLLLAAVVGLRLLAATLLLAEMLGERGRSREKPRAAYGPPLKPLAPNGARGAGAVLVATCHFHR